MLGLLKRNLQLYFGDRSGVLFSLLGALIAFVLYIVFLKHNMSLSWGNIPHKNELLDNWLIGGTLATTAITTTGHATSLAVMDREKGRLVDLMLTDIHPANIQATYIFNGMIVGTIMQLVMLLGLTTYFRITDQLGFDWSLTPQLLIVMVLNAATWTSFNVLIQSFIRRMSTLSTVHSLLGTAAGFFVGVYMPIGMLPKAAQHLIEWTPAPYSASLYRRILLSQPLRDTFNGHSVAQTTFEKSMGIGININGLTTWTTDTIILCACSFIFAIIIGIVAHRSQLLAVQRS
ncbi:MAG: ABC transporter permease [Lactobacillus sp.]|nr:MAG: ABC transporter permease [Lactobacillus sp.]